MAFNGTGSNVTSLNAANISSGTLAVGRGGTGATTLNAAAVIIGNGTSAPTFVAPGTSGNVLTSNGSAWASTAPAGGGVTSLNGLTGALDGIAFISTTSIPANATTINITGLPSGLKRILIGLDFLTTSNNDSFNAGFRFSTNNGSSYISSNYFIDVPGGGSVDRANVSGQTIAGAQIVRYQGWGVIIQPQGNTLTSYEMANSHIQSGNYYQLPVARFVNSNNSYVNAIQLVKDASSKQFTGGSITLWGQK